MRGNSENYGSIPSKAAYQTYNNDVKNLIQEFGWMVQMVAPTIDDTGAPFAYTVGLSKTFNHPELIIVGVSPDIGGAILNIAGARIKQGENFKLEPDQNVRLVSELFGGKYVAAIKSVTQCAKLSYLCQAVRLYGEGGFDALQIVMPDKSGKFPWDNEYDRNVMKCQDKLF